MSDDERYLRQLDLLGAAGQDRIARSIVGYVGLGGLGSHHVRLSAYLGVRNFVLVDGDLASNHSLNRLVTAYPGDVGEFKVELARREILAIAPTAAVTVVRKHVPDPAVLTALAVADLIVGGVDHDLPRIKLTDFASSHGIPYIDVATDVAASENRPPIYGGRVICAGIGPGCLHCLGELDSDAIRRASMTDEQLIVEAAIYGVPVESLRPQTGPAVVTINSVVASLAITEAMAMVTGLRLPRRHLVYRGDIGTVRVNIDPPQPGCPYCARWTGA